MYQDPGQTVGSKELGSFLFALSEGVFDWLTWHNHMRCSAEVLGCLDVIAFDWTVNHLDFESEQKKLGPKCHF